MATASHAELDKHLQKVLGAAGYTNSGSTVTVSAINLSSSQLSELIRAANVERHEVSIVAGAVTIKPV